MSSKGFFMLSTIDFTQHKKATGRKILYRESDIEKMLQESYREVYMSSK